MSSTRSAAEPVYKSAQRLRWFVGAFHDEIARITSETGVGYDVDSTNLTKAYVGWLDAFEAQKPSEDTHNEAYVGFAAGLMLRFLVDENPVTVSEPAPELSANSPLGIWPEGYLYVRICLNIRDMVLSQDFNRVRQPSAELDMARTWWSFRENVTKEPSITPAFLDLFAGEDPHWFMPDVFHPHPPTPSR